MSGTAVAAPPVVNFEQDIVKVAALTVTAFRMDAFERQQARQADPRSSADPEDVITTSMRAELMATAPSLIASKACGAPEVIVHVRRGNALWSPDLQRAAENAVGAHKSASGGRVRMRIVHI